MSSRTAPLLAALALVMGASALADAPSVPLGTKLTRARPQADFVQFGKGVTEYSILGNFNLTDPTSQDISLRVAPFMNRNVQIGGDFSYHNNGGNSGFIGGIVNYYPGKETKRTNPYVGGAVGTTFGDPGTCLEWGFQGGVKHFIASDVALTGELQYRRMGDLDWSGALLGLTYFGGRSPVGHDFMLPVKGTREIDVNGRFNFDDPEEEFFEFLYGMFLNSHSEVALDVSIDHIHTNATSRQARAASRGTTSSDFTGGFIGGVYNYHFANASHGRSLPYAGVHLGTTWGDGPNVASYGAQLGLKYFLTKNVAFRPELDWTHLDRSGPGADQTSIRMGLAFFLP